MELGDAIEHLYAAFAPYPRSAVGGACSHCVTPEDLEALDGAPLRSLSAEQLSRYGFKALTTWGDADEYKHFFPRIIELAISVDGQRWPGFDFRVISEKVRLAGGESWPSHERVALEDVLRALWRAVLARDPQDGSWSATWLLAELPALAPDVSPYLEAWSRDRSLPSALQLADLVESTWWDLASRGRLRGWLDGAARNQVERWLVDPARREFLAASFDGHHDGPHGDRLAAAVDAWDWMVSSLR